MEEINNWLDSPAQFRHIIAVLIILVIMFLIFGQIEVDKLHERIKKLEDNDK